MALSKGALPIKFSGGIETKMTPEAVPSTRLLTLENGVFTRAVSIRKRNGYEALSSVIDGSSGTLSGLIRLGDRDSELLGFTPEACYSHQADADVWSDTGDVYSVVGADRPVVRTGTEQTHPDQASLDGVSVYAWEDSAGGVYYTVADTASGRIHIAPTQAHASGISPRCVAVGTALHIYYAVAALGRVYVIVVNPASPSVSVTPAILVDDMSTTNPVYDACPTTRDGTPAAMAWNERGTTNLRIGYVDQGGALGTALTGHPSVITDPVGLDTASPIAIAHAEDDGLSGGSALLVAYIAGGGEVRSLSGGDAASSTAIGAEATATATAHSLPVSVQRIALGVSDDGDNLAWVAYEEAAVEPTQRYVVVNSVLYFGAEVREETIRSVGLASRAFTPPDSEHVFAVFLHDSTYFNTYLTLRLSDSHCIARSLPGLAADAPTRKHLPSAHVNESMVSIALPYNERLASANDDQFTETGIRLLTLDFDSEDSHQYAQLGRGLYLAGACPMHYDGRQWSEQGFHVGPELITSSNGTSGSLTPSSTYLYRAYYEWTDAQGEVHRGPVSFGTLATLAGGGAQDEVTLTLPTLRITGKSNVRICVARSRPGESGSTAELFLVTSRDPTATGANGYVENDPTVNSVTFNDRMSDATLITQEPLYTNGGILSNDPCALGSVIERSKRRLFTTDPADPFAVRFSQRLEDGYGVEFAPELVIKCDPAGGPIGALADLDGTVIVWQANAIRAVDGDGPTETGDVTGGGFTEPRRLSSAVGCADPASIVETPNGYIFSAGSKGLWEVNRSGQVSYVGAPAEAYNAQRTVAASLLPERTGIVFLTDDGTTLLYDYFFGQWGTWTNHTGYDAVVVNGQYHYLRTDGRVFRETIDEFSDAGQRITLRLTTAWIHMTEVLQGFQFFWNTLLLGTWRSAHQLGISHRTDYGGQWTETYYLDATGETSSSGWITGDNADEIGVEPISGSEYGDGEYGDGEYGGSTPGVYQWRYHVGEHGESVQFRFEDFERVGLTGAAFELTELLVEGGVAGTSNKPFTAARSA